jgi:lysophospholipase L1-like esterase
MTMLQAVRGGRILAFGDSLTAGTFFGTRSRIEGTHPYADRLSRLLNDEVEVIESGINGQTTLKMLRRLPSLLDRHPSNLVIILGGLNDLAVNRDPDSIVETITEIHEVALSRSTQARPTYTLAVTLPQLGVDGDHPLSAGITEVNEGIRAFAEQNSDRIALLDIENTFNMSNGESNSRYWSADFIHLSPLGYDTVGTLIYKTIANKVLPEPEST